MKFQLAAAVAAAMVLETNAAYYPDIAFYENFYCDHLNMWHPSETVEQFYQDGKPAIDATRIEFKQTTASAIFSDVDGLVEVVSMQIFDLHNPYLCKAEIALTSNKPIDYTTATIDLSDIAHYHPCFQQNSTVVFGLGLATYEGKVSPSVFLPGKYRVNIAPRTDGIPVTKANYFLSYDSFVGKYGRGFLWRDLQVDTTVVTPTIECPLPSEEEQKTYEEVPMAVSGIGYRHISYDEYIGPSPALQIRVVPNRDGCSMKSPVNIFGFDDSSDTTLVNQDCYGYAYATYIKQNTQNGQFVCGSRIPVKIPLSPDATSKVFLKSHHYYGVKDYELKTVVAPKLRGN